MYVFNINEVYLSLYCVYFNFCKKKWPTTPEILVPTDTPEMWCHRISGAIEIFADVAPLFAYGTRPTAPRYPVLLEHKYP